VPDGLITSARPEMNFFECGKIHGFQTIRSADVETAWLARAVLALAAARASEVIANGLWISRSSQ
jgi:hypothetical protein